MATHKITLTVIVTDDENAGAVLSKTTIPVAVPVGDTAALQPSFAGQCMGPPSPFTTSDTMDSDWITDKPGSL
jgi:hypothetical protein